MDQDPDETWRHLTEEEESLAQEEESLQKEMEEERKSIDIEMNRQIDYDDGDDADINEVSMGCPFKVHGGLKAQLGVWA